MSGYTNLNSKLDNSRNCLRRIARHDDLQFSKDSIVNVMEKFVKTVNVMDETILVPCRLMDRQVGDSTDIIPAPGKDSTSNQHSHGKRNGGAAMNSKNIHEFLHSSELFNLYNVLNALKTELLWSGKDENVLVDSEQHVAAALNECETRIAGDSPDSKTDAAAAATSSPTATATTTVKGHIRRPSTASVASTASASNISDSESDISTNENDSGVESEGNKSDTAQSSADSVSSSDSDALKANNNNVDKATELAKRCRRHLTGLYQCLEQMTEASNYLTARYQSDIGAV